MVNIEINVVDIGMVVRFTRRTWGGLLKGQFIRLDATVIIAPQFEEDLLADFAIYRQLDEASQKVYLKTMLTTRYSGRLLSDRDLPFTIASPLTSRPADA